MAILNLFSRRQKELRGEVPDVYTYDHLPDSLRVQIIQIWQEGLGGRDYYEAHFDEFGTRSLYKFIVEGLCREYGLFQLDESTGHTRNYMSELGQFFMAEQKTERLIDVIELTFTVINTAARESGYLQRSDASGVADTMTNELNHRFRLSTVGYQFDSGQIVLIDSEFVHQQVVRPALKILSQAHQSGAQQEFLQAHKRYRERRPKEALNEALKSFESTLKAICDRRSWAYPTNATSKTLLDLCFDKGLIPAFWQTNMGGIRSILEGGVPPARNRLGGHGQGTEPTTVPDHIVSYVLHMTASAIIFLAAADETLK